MSEEVQQIILSSGVLTVRKINRKTKAVMFKNLKVGSKVEFSIPLKSVGTGSRGGSNAAYVVARDLETNETNTSSFNQLKYVLDAFEFEAQQ